MFYIWNVQTVVLMLMFVLAQVEVCSVTPLLHRVPQTHSPVPFILGDVRLTFKVYVCLILLNPCSIDLIYLWTKQCCFHLIADICHCCFVFVMLSLSL